MRASALIVPLLKISTMKRLTTLLLAVLMCACVSAKESKWVEQQCVDLPSGVKMEKENGVYKKVLKNRKFVEYVINNGNADCPRQTADLYKE